ncbi:hypothetical protein [Nocardioides guangzhouensis]|uniref:hypothetical protein n=1 Tax=Nocardioides guangzhouensis TaxID=2497878 RepID=UPI00158DC679|nr:hypothetical protein [Nocardioides guangzhouensis]
MAGQLAATEAGVGFWPVLLQAASARTAAAYSESLRLLCSDSCVKVCTREPAVPAPPRVARYAASCSTNAVGSSIACTVSVGSVT